MKLLTSCERKKTGTCLEKVVGSLSVGLTLLGMVVVYKCGSFSAILVSYVTYQAVLKTE